MASNVGKKNTGVARNSSPLLHDLGGLLFLFLAVFTLLSLLSFSSLDPSFFTASRSQAKNLGGVLGSHWASLLLQIMGAAAFLQAAVFLLAGIALFRRITRSAWILASLNFVLLLISAAACFGLWQRPLAMGGTNIPMGGLLGELLGGSLRAYLNTPGAALLAGSFFLLSISISTRVSVRDLGLYAWLGISKSAVFIAGGIIYVGMHVWSAAASSYAKMRPIAIRSFAQLWIKTAVAINHLNEKRKTKKTEKSPAKVEAPVAATKAEPTIEIAQSAPMAEVIPLRKEIPAAVAIASTEDAALKESSGPDIILERETSEESDARALFDSPSEMEASAGQKSKSSPIMSFMKKAAKENEKSVKNALGRKVNYELPPLSFLNTPITEETKIDREELLRSSKMLEEKLADFNVNGVVTAVKPGPVVTMFEFKPAAGVKVNSISNLADDLALALSATSIRIVAPVPGRDVVGIEVPNKSRESVLLKEIIGSDTFQSRNHSIPIAIGKDILGGSVVADLKKMPHLLVAGTTGSGKSVFINSLICSLMYKFTPEDMKLILVDPKQLELAPYNDIPHLLLPVVTEPKKASLALNWAVNEMERRYRVIAKSITRDQESYNKKLEDIGESKMSELLNKGKESFEEHVAAERMPKLVIVIDELADLMMTAKSDVENNICRLAQKARAAGVHLVLATQRPSTDVVTGLIKANLPSRICFKVSSKVDSRVMFDAMGAEKLIGMGDMLFMPPGDSRLVRMHGAYISVEEVDQIANFWRAQEKPTYREDILVEAEDDFEGEGAFSSEDANDPLYQQALDIAYSSGAISASYLQRRLRIGYNKAARFVEMMEAQGVVGPADGSKPRPILSPRP
jgi:S-DNA-T family DNA segregation ATPase FtsK/SpoIIIE